MGLFRIASRRHSNASWANNSASNINAEEKRAFCDSMSSQETTSWSPHSSFTSTSYPSATSHGNKDVDALSLEVQMLEAQLQRKDETISQLMEAGDERVKLLERQLERLVELSSSQCAAHQGTTISLGSKKVKRQSVTSGDCDDPQHEGTQDKQDAELETSALQELLARVIAEKDQLRSQNLNLREHLKWLLKERDDHARPSSNGDNRGSSHSAIDELDTAIRPSRGIRKMPFNMPSAVDQLGGHSTIDELDTAIWPSRGISKIPSKRPSNIDQLDSMTQDKEHKKKCQKGKCQDTINSLDECQRGSPKEDVSEERESKNNVPAAAAEEQHTVHYQMSCRKCTKDHSHLKYSIDDSLVNLPKSLKMHYAQVWKMVQQHQDDGGSISSSVHDDEWSKEIDFPSSSLAGHLVKHCQLMPSEDDVLKWCMKNIKVEIEKKTEVDDYEVSCKKENEQITPWLI